MTKGSPLTDNIKKEMKILERTIKLLGFIEKNQPVSINKLSQLSELPEHKVRYSLRMLQKEGLISPTSKGAVTTKKHDVFKNHMRELLNRLSELSVRLQKQMGK